MAECDLACQTKIIINGGNAARLLDVACNSLEYMSEKQKSALKGDEIIGLLNRMESDAIAVQNLILDAAGYKGPRGDILD